MLRDNEFYVDLGERIFNLRESQRISRSELSKIVGISPKFLYEIEKGKKGFTVQVLKEIADALHISCDSLVWGGKKKRK